MEEFKNGIDPDGGKADPSLEQFRDKATEKLRNLNMGDRQYGKKTAQQIYGRKDEDKTITTFPNRKRFKKIILSASNSGAKDTYGLSLKMTKIMIKFNAGFFEILYKLMAAMARTGKIPKEWKVDIILFLYKKKGTDLTRKTGGRSL